MLFKNVEDHQVGLMYQTELCHLSVTQIQCKLACKQGQGCICASVFLFLSPSLSPFLCMFWSDSHVPEDGIDGCRKPPACSSRLWPKGSEYHPRHPSIHIENLHENSGHHGSGGVTVHKTDHRNLDSAVGTWVHRCARDGGGPGGKDRPGPWEVGSPRRENASPRSWASKTDSRYLRRGICPKYWTLLSTTLCLTPRPAHSCSYGPFSVFWFFLTCGSPSDGLLMCSNSIRLFSLPPSIIHSSLTTSTHWPCFLVIFYSVSKCY